MGGLLGQAGGVVHLEPAGSITQGWGLNILGLKGTTLVKWGQGDPPLQTQMGRHGQVCRERSQSQSSSCWGSCVHSLQLSAPKYQAAPGPAAMSAEALCLEIRCPGLSGVKGPGERVCARAGESSNGGRGSRSERPRRRPQEEVQSVTRRRHRAELGLGAPTLGDTTLMSSLRKRNLPTSSWNLLPQLFMHVSSTWGEAGCGDPGEGQRRRPRREKVTCEDKRVRRFRGPETDHHLLAWPSRYHL